MLTAAAVIAASYAIGSVPVAWLVARLRGGIDLRTVGSGNTGASNLWRTVSKKLVVPVGLAQVGQGLAGILIARVAGEPSSVQVACGVAAIAAYNWSPWLGLQGGRGIGPAIGYLLALTPFDALPVFIAVALLGVPAGASPLSVAAALLATPIAAYAGGEPRAVVAGCGVVAVMVLVKRVLGNEPPEAGAPRPGVYVTRLLYDRDIRDREAWVRRHVGG
jgi:glycerol-3-phosphate acyltransferase PlsY